MNKYKQFLKTELHLHLDCSLSYDVVKKIDPSVSAERYKNEFIAPAKCMDLADYISRARRGFELMQNQETLREVTLDLFNQLEQDHVIYAEIRFAPLQHIFGGLSAQQVVEVVGKALIEGREKTGIEAGLILCTLRHFTEKQGLETAKLPKEFQHLHILGIDLAANEAAYPINEHIAAFHFAHENGILCTAHAGEARGAESVWETIRQLKPNRIGHGVRSTEDPILIEFLKENKIHLEICPTSNIQTNMYDSIEGHPIRQLYDYGISISINTDARTISNVSLSDEYEILAKAFNWDGQHFRQCNLNAIEYAFIPEAKKKLLREKLNLAYAEFA